MNDAHRKAAEQHELAAHAHRTAPNTTKEATTKREIGMGNGRLRTRIMLAGLKPTPNQGRW